MEFCSQQSLLSAFGLILVASCSYAQDGLSTGGDLPYSGEGRSATAEPLTELRLEGQTQIPPPNEITVVDGEQSTAVQAILPPPTVVNEPGFGGVSSGINLDGDAARFAEPFAMSSDRFRIGLDLYSSPEFEGGLIVFGKDVAMKMGGYVKADFIHDFNPIDSTDSFVTTDIPVGAPARTNTSFHARQTRLSFDTRWISNRQPIRVFVEGDFFSEGNGYRLRHAYGEVGSLLIGQTWTTFTDVAAAPATLDFEGSVSSVNRRHAMVRWTRPVFHEDLTLAFAAENADFNIDVPPGITGQALSPSPDLVARIRLSKDWGQFQVAQLVRVGGFQRAGGMSSTTTAWGLNFTGTILLTDTSKFYSQVIFGEGIGSYRGLPDAVPESATTGSLLGMSGWMVGYTRNWNDRLNSNFTYAENILDNTAFQQPDDVHKTTYLAANLIWEPVERVNVGVEYLYGSRENINRETGVAHRVQVAFILQLP